MADVIVIQSDLRKAEKQRLRVGAYARVSSNSLEQEDSFHNQVRYYTKYHRRFNISRQILHKSTGHYAEFSYTGLLISPQTFSNRILCSSLVMSFKFTRCISILSVITLSILSFVFFIINSSLF